MSFFYFCVRIIIAIVCTAGPVVKCNGTQGNAVPHLHVLVCLALFVFVGCMLVAFHLALYILCSFH